MSAHLSRLRLFQRHLRSLVWVGVWVWDWIHSHTPPRPRSPSSRPPPFTHYPFPPRSLVCGGQPSPHKPRLVVSTISEHMSSASSTILLLTRAQLCNRSCSNKYTPIKHIDHDIFTCSKMLIPVNIQRNFGFLHAMIQLGITMNKNQIPRLHVRIEDHYLQHQLLFDLHHGRVFW